MNRELKFRVFDPNTNQMINNLGIGDISYYDFDGDNITEQEGLIIMQYIGLKDKNGKEIYEGDIDISDEPMFVIYQDGRFGLKFNKESKYFDSCISWEHIEIGGNIYQNLNLLNMKNY